MQVTVIPQYPEALAEDRLFEFEEYDPTDAYGADRAGFAALSERLTDEGHQVHTPDVCNPTDADVVVFIDMNFDYLDRLLALDETPGLVYVMREPPSVRRYNSASELLRYTRLFDSVLTWNSSLVSNAQNIHEYNIPQYLETVAGEVPPFEEQSLLVNISSRKYSSHPEELYSERERIIQYYDEVNPSAFTLYGLYWNQRHRIEDVYHHGKFRSKRYRTYEGLVDDKATAYANHRFALCFENMTGIEGYVTEKLFDCLRAGAVPVYWGATDIDRYVPDDVYVDYRSFGTPEAVDEYLRSVGPEEYREYLNAGRAFLDSDPDHLKTEQYAESVSEAVERSLNRNRGYSSALIRREVSKLGQIKRLDERPEELGRYERLRTLTDVLRRQPSNVLANPRAILSTAKSFLR